MILRIAALVEIEITKLVRQSFFYAVLVTALLATLLSIAGTVHRFDPSNANSFVFGQNCFLRATSRGCFVGSYLVLVWTSMTISHESGLGLYRLLLPKPLSRMDLFIAKGITSALFMLLVVWLVVLVSYGLTGEILGYGDIMDYGESPAILNVRAVELNGIMVRGLLLSLPSLLTLCGFGLLCSTMTDNSGFAVGSAMGGMMLMQLLGTMVDAEFKKWLFISYLPPLNFAEIMAQSPLLNAIDASKGFSGDWSASSSTFAILCPLAFFVVFFGVAAIIFARKDLTN